MSPHDREERVENEIETQAEIEREYGPFPDAAEVHGVTYDGTHVWFASGDKLNAIDPASGSRVRALEVVAVAGTAYDGRFLYQLSGKTIQKIDPTSSKTVAEIPAPEPHSDNAGLTWAEGSLWLARYRARQILQLDPQNGAVLRTLESDRFVTGVTFAEGELWHATWEKDASELRAIDPHSGRVRARVHMPAGTMISGLEFDGRDRFYCGGGPSGRVRALRKPKRGSTR